MSEPAARRLLAALVAAFVLYGLALATLSPAGFPAGLATGSRMPWLAGAPLGEDGYYMLTVAWHWGAGDGMVYNFGRPTTGIQPLATALYAGLARLVQTLGGVRWTFARLVLAFLVLLQVAFAHLVGCVARRLAATADRDTAYFFGVVGGLFAYSLFRHFTYGLETGLYLTLFAGLVVLSLRAAPAFLDDRPRAVEVASFGLLGGAVWLTRIDFGVVLAGFLALALVARPRRLPALAAAGALAALPPSLWLLRVHALTSRWMPGSGVAESEPLTLANAGLRIVYTAKALVDQLAPWAYTLQHDLPSLAALVSVVAYLLWLRRGGRLLAPERSREGRVAAAWAAAQAPLWLVYLAFFGATYFYARYAAPLAVLALAWLAAATARRLGPAAPAWARLALPAVFALWAAVTLHNGRLGNSHALAAGFLQQERFAGLRAGALQSGVIGYYDPEVYNLDGKMDAAALPYLQAGRLDRYVDRRRIDLLLLWPEEIGAQIDRGYLARGWTSCGALADGHTLCFARRGGAAARRAVDRPAGR